MPEKINSPWCLLEVRLCSEPFYAKPQTIAPGGKCSLARIIASVGVICAQFWFCSRSMQPNFSTFIFHAVVSYVCLFIYLLTMFSRLVPNHQTACERVPLNMLSKTHNMDALCCCDDISLPALIKCFVKLPEKIFSFLFPANPMRGTERKQCLRAALLSSSLLPTIM